MSLHACLNAHSCEICAWPLLGHSVAWQSPCLCSHVLVLSPIHAHRIVHARMLERTLVQCMRFSPDLDHLNSSDESSTVMPCIDALVPECAFTLCIAQSS